MSVFDDSLRDLDFTTSEDRTYPATEDSAERGFAPLDKTQHDPTTYKDLGHGDELGEEPVGDIADEGRGHRG